jgi:hypothetical protein
VRSVGPDCEQDRITPPAFADIPPVDPSVLQLCQNHAAKLRS